MDGPGAGAGAVAVGDTVITPEARTEAAARIPPNDTEAEAALLGAMLLSRDAISVAMEHCRADDFYKPAHGHVFEAISNLHSAGEPVDAVTVADRLRRAGLLEAIGGQNVLIDLLATTPSTSSAGRYGRIVADHAALRRLIGAAHGILDLAYGIPEDVQRSLDRAESLVSEIGQRRSPTNTQLCLSQTIDEFLKEDEADHDWILPGLLEREDRLVLTGPEGMGKSTLLRQIGVQVASGVHPFTLEPIDAVAVLLVDLENGTGYLRRELRRLHSKVARSLEPARFRIRSEPAGIDLGTPEGSAWLADRVAASQPDLLIIGPVYKMATGDSTIEEVARKITAPIDAIRAQHHCAVILEAHNPYSANGGRRPTRPFGSSVWSRWPEFGLHLSENGQVTHWRGQRDEREWPSALKRGGDWPWTVETDSRALTFARILDETRRHGSQLSLRDLESRLGASKDTIGRAIKANQRQYDEVIEELGK